MTEQELLYASPEDIDTFNHCTAGLPTQSGNLGTGLDKDGVPIPYSCGAHSVKALREIVSIVNPTSILEIGFNIGHSASLWLHLSKAKLVSIDISNKNETIEASFVLRNRYPDRFFFLIGDSKNIRNRSDYKHPEYDLIFIDGGHLLDDVVADIELAISFGIPYIAFDDILPQYGDVQKAIDKFEHLTLVKEIGNIALYKNNYKA